MGRPGLDVDAVRAEFPFFAAHPDLAYLDSAATTQKPRAVLDAVEQGSDPTRLATDVVRRVSGRHL